MFPGENQMYLQLIQNALDDSTNFIFFVVISLLTSLGVILVLVKKLQTFRGYIPSLCASIGVFGTFLGIYLGLSSFNTSNISDSIPKLLDGMKTAFFTSLVGMASSLFLKGIYSLFADSRSENDDEISLLQGMENSSRTISNFMDPIKNEISKLGGEIDNVNNTLKEISIPIGKLVNIDLSSQNIFGTIDIIKNEISTNLNKIENIDKSITEYFSHIKKLEKIEEYNQIIANSMQPIQEQISICSNEISQMSKTIVDLFKSDADHSLITQITLIRTEIRDNHLKTLAALQRMIDEFANLASKSLVEQLNSVVGKFNDMLNDLVAESFNKLTISTDNLNKWQESYKEQVTNNEENLKRISASLIALESIYGSISDKTDSITMSMASIDMSLANVNISGDKLVLISDTLHQQTELFYKNLEQIKKIGDDAKIVIPEIDEKINLMILNVNDLQAKSVQFIDETSDIIKNTMVEFQRNVNEQNSQYTQHIKDSTELLGKSSRELSQQVENSSKSLDELVKHHLQSTQEGLKESLSKSLESFAGMLAALSQKFAEDYSPLTDRLREIVRISERVKQDSHSA